VKKEETALSNDRGLFGGKKRKENQRARSIEESSAPPLWNKKGKNGRGGGGGGKYADNGRGGEGREFGDLILLILLYREETEKKKKQEGRGRR